MRNEVSGSSSTRWRWVGVLVAMAALWSGVCFADEAPKSRYTPVEIVRQSDHILRGKTTAAVLGMAVHTGSYDRDYKVVYWEDDSGGPDRVLIKILGPALWRGNGTLKVGGRLSLYDPRSDRVTDLSSSMLGDSWMGSHFSNDDFVKETDLATDYKVAPLKEWQAPAPDGKPALFHTLQLTPTPSAPVSWDHLLLTAYETSDALIPTEIRYFRRAGDQAARTLTFSDVKTLGGRRVPSVLKMVVADKPGEFTRITYQAVKFDAPIPESKFTEQALKGW